MAYGDISLFTVGYTATDSGSLRKNYPIKKKYKQIDRSTDPSFPSSYSLYDTTNSYWFPFIVAEPSDDDYIVYESGDEYAWNDDLELRPPALRFANPNLRKYADYPALHRIVYANDIYVSTNYYFNWTDTKFNPRNNPYKSNRVRKWKKLNDTNDVWIQYWYHPLLKKFYVLADIDKIQELPNFDEIDQTRWDRFIGDSQDLNIENFTLAQIRELVSTGSSQSSAEAAISAIEARAISSNSSSQTTGTQTATTTGSATFSITNTASGQEGDDSTEALESLPSMYQRKLNPRTRVKEIVDRYYFNIRPNKISYSDIGANWVPVERVNNFPIIDYRNPKLMKISFEFVVEQQTGGISSLYESCEQQLLLLRRMATTAERVQFTNFDSLFTEAVAIPQNLSTAHEFAIVEMSINSIVRTPTGNTSIQGNISRATVNMTIQEVRVNDKEIIFMPKLGKDEITTGGGGGGGGGDPSLCLLVAEPETAKILGQEPCKSGT